MWLAFTFYLIHFSVWTSFNETISSFFSLFFFQSHSSFVVFILFTVAFYFVWFFVLSCVFICFLFSFLSLLYLSFYEYNTNFMVCQLFKLWRGQIFIFFLPTFRFILFFLFCLAPGRTNATILLTDNEWIRDLIRFKEACSELKFILVALCIFDLFSHAVVYVFSLVSPAVLSFNRKQN